MIAVSVFIIAIGGFDSPNNRIKKTFNQPLGPINATKPAATTTVGIIKGIVVSIRKIDLPGNLSRAKMYADGIPKIAVKKVDKSACQIENFNGCQVLSNSFGKLNCIADASKILVKIEDNGKT
jgi:hypothetical protein